MFRKMILLFLAYIMICPVMTRAENSNMLTNANGFVYQILDEGTVAIVGYTGSKAELIIPSEIDGHRVSLIASRAFSSNNTIVSVEIPGEVKKIDGAAFIYCGKLETVYLHEGVETLAEAAFLYCHQMTAIHLPASFTEFSGNPVAGCRGLTTIDLAEDNPALKLTDGVLFSKDGKILLCYPVGKSDDTYAVPAGTETVARHAFNSSRLVDIQLPESVVQVGESAFTMCSELAHINIPSGVSTLDDVFTSCQSLQRIDISKDNPYLESIDNVVFKKDDHALQFYPAGKEDENYRIPEGTTRIGGHAFLYSRLKSVEISGSVKTIGYQAFGNSKDLSTIILQEGIEELEGVCFNFTGIKEIYLPRSLKMIRENPFEGCESLYDIIVDDDHPIFACVDGVLIDKESRSLICYPMARECDRFIIPEGVERLERNSLNRAPMRELIIPEGVKVMYQSIAQCPNLERVWLPASLEEMDIAHTYRIAVGSKTLQDIEFVVAAGSYAENYCLSYGLRVAYQ